MPSQALGIYSIYKLVRAFFEERIVKRYIEVVAFVGYYVLTSLIYLFINIPIANFAVNIISIFLLTFMYVSSIKKKLYVDGKPQLMDIVLNNPTYGTNVALNYYALNISMGLLDWSRTTVNYTDAQKAALEIWSEGDTDYNYPTNVTMTTQESEEFNRTYSDISTNVSENVLAFITGSRPLDDENWDAFVSGIEGMGIQKCVELKQAALDRYLSR